MTELTEAVSAMPGAPGAVPADSGRGTLTDGTGAPLARLHSGKVRDLYRTADGLLLMVASDRISAYDHILSTPIPDKGRVLTALSVWWFERLGDVVENHVVAHDSPVIPERWRGRALLCRPLEMLPVECVARGYLAGSGWLDYRRSGQVCGVPLPPGLLDGSRLPEPIFTPATKADVGAHDENVSLEQVTARVGAATAGQLRDATLAIYSTAARIAAERGIILADTKFEFGRAPDSGELVLGDEALTPDSSRFWPADRWEPGHAQPSYDKQFVRDWLASPASGWDRAGDQPPPPLPEDIIAATRMRYIEAYERLTGVSFADWPGTHAAAADPAG